MNFFEVMKDAFGPFMDGEKKPLHVGEVMNLWFYLHGTEQTLRYDQNAYNLVKDPELKEKIADIIENVHRPMINELTQFFKDEGIPLPDVGAEKVIGEYKDLPEGAGLNDEEIANLISYNLVVGITSATRGITESVRSDVGYLFAKYHMMKITFSLTFKALMQEKGWLRVPPYYTTGKQ
ncbi:DUF3231 family protein [Mesobacillus boroniphilus]|uniref:DUF3231 family protein n=1 Tax=Mesobacillus boroniphilus TaxID=308892 RepID=A0A944GVS0_9BACI|nr:DUF3231 family protein [Mesobacillus boroniphilus]MBS8264173.1 DUF3231 family protein [Mesobacillus boroniphilus]